MSSGKRWLSTMLRLAAGSRCRPSSDSQELVVRASGRSSTAPCRHSRGSSRRRRCSKNFLNMHVGRLHVVVVVERHDDAQHGLLGRCPDCIRACLNICSASFSRPLDSRMWPYHHHVDVVAVQLVGLGRCSEGRLRLRSARCRQRPAPDRCPPGRASRREPVSALLQRSMASSKRPRLMRQVP